MNLEGDLSTDPGLEPLLEDRWVMSRVTSTAQEVGRAIEEYNFDKAASQLYQFAWHEFCDWYLELAKPRLYNDDDPQRQLATRRVLAEVFSRLLRMLHPLMPFISEELYQRLPNTQGSIMTAEWPMGDPAAIDPAAEADMQLLMETISAVRNIRGEMGLNPGQAVPVVLIAQDEQAREMLEGHKDRITVLAKATDISFAPADQPPAQAASQALARVTVFVPLEGLIDFAAEQERLTKQIAKIEKELAPTRGKLKNQGFLSKAPEEVVAKEREKLAEGQDRILRLQHNLDKISSFLA
jgi:valyl-tRNA synthetase